MNKPSNDFMKAAMDEQSIHLSMNVFFYRARKIL